MQQNSRSGEGLRKDPVLRVQAIGSACVVTLAGELDLYNADSVRKALFEAAGERPERIVSPTQSPAGQ